MNKKQKELPFYNAFNEKPYIQRLNTIDMMRKLPFYHELNKVKTSKAFKRYVTSYSIKKIDSKDPSLQLTIIKY